VRLLQTLVKAGRDVHLTISPAGRQVLAEELGLDVDLKGFAASSLLSDSGDPPWDVSLALPRALTREDSGGDTAHWSAGERGKLYYHHYQDYTAPIASGSHRTAGMVVCPCSCGTLSAIVHGSAGNLIQRAADVHLKERRKLVLAPRETPLSIPQLENLLRACRMGAVVLPAMPGWYHGVRGLGDLVDFVVARVLDQLEVDHGLMRRWGEGGGDV
jgi:4-hydroxy-3-polyprenylbenzoate decarboxylase